MGLLVVLAMASTVSTYVTNMAWVFLLANWVIEGNWKEKFADFKENSLLQAYLVLVTVAVAALFWSDNVSYGIDCVRHWLPLLAIPLVVLTSAPLKPNHVRRIMLLYAATVTVVSIIGFVRYLTIPNLPYRQIVPYISHIRFALNVCLVVCVLIGLAVEPAFNFCQRQVQEGRVPDRQSPMEAIRDIHGIFLREESQRHFDWISILCVVTVAWLLFFLLLIQSYTAYIILFVVAAVLLAVYWRRIYANGIKWSLLLIMTVAVGVAAIVTTVNVRSYYRMVPMAIAPLQDCTANGRPYSHACDGLVENGNYVNNYVCRDELRTQWNLRSGMNVDSLTAGGYPVYSTLIRYLNNLGLTKDSVGVAHLLPRDISAIEHGEANPVYRQRSFKRMVYVMLFEREMYVHFHAVKGYTMLQRFELWRAGWQAFLEHPLFGAGTGDAAAALQTQLQVQQSSLSDSGKHTHNQYLAFLVAFGSIGFGIIVFFFVRAFVREKMYLPPLLLVCLCIVLVSFLSEDTLDTLAGAVFTCFFPCLLVRQKRSGNVKS